MKIGMDTDQGHAHPVIEAPAADPGMDNDYMPDAEKLAAKYMDEPPAMLDHGRIGLHKSLDQIARERNLPTKNGNFDNNPGRDHRPPAAVGPHGRQPGKRGFIRGPAQQPFASGRRASFEESGGSTSPEEQLASLTLSEGTVASHKQFNHRGYLNNCRSNRNRNDDRNGDGWNIPSYGDLDQVQQLSSLPPIYDALTKQKTTVTFMPVDSSISEADIKELCDKFGKTTSTRVICGTGDGASGFAVADFIDADAAERTVAEYDQRTLDGKLITCFIRPLSPAARPPAANRGKCSVFNRLNPIPAHSHRNDRFMNVEKKKQAPFGANYHLRPSGSGEKMPTASPPREIALITLKQSPGDD